jgi:hypothetical protein
MLWLNASCSYLNKVNQYLAFYRGTMPVLCIVGPRISLQYMGLAFYKPIFEKFEEKSILPAHSSAGLAGVCTGITQAVTLGKTYCSAVFDRVPDCCYPSDTFGDVKGTPTNGDDHHQRTAKKVSWVD